MQPCLHPHGCNSRGHRLSLCPDCLHSQTLSTFILDSSVLFFSPLTHLIACLIESLFHYISRNCIHSHAFAIRHYPTLSPSYTPRLQPSYDLTSLYNPSPSSNKFSTVSCSGSTSYHTSIPLVVHFPSPYTTCCRLRLNLPPLGVHSSPLPHHTRWPYPPHSLLVIHTPYNTIFTRKTI